MVDKLSGGDAGTRVPGTESPDESQLFPHPDKGMAMTDDRVFYGPHPCDVCGKTIAVASRTQGGEKFEYPDGPIYPNTVWARHNCERTVEQNSGASTGFGLPT